jgi:hypothetical protein
MKKLILIVALILSATSFVCAQDTPLLMRTPTMNKTHIVFRTPAICGRWA